VTILVVSGDHPSGDHPLSYCTNSRRT